jgi:hypothetical protein
MKNKLRIVQVYKNKKWITVRMKELKVGDKFRMFESKNERFKDGKRSVWIVVEKPKQLKNGIFEITAE